MEEYYPMLWFFLFIGWLFFTAFFMFKTSNDDNIKSRSNEKDFTKISILGHNDSNCNCGHCCYMCMSHSEY